MIKEFHQSIAALAKVLNVDVQPLSREWYRIYRTRLQSRGARDAVKFMKELNTVAERYALHQDIEPIPWTISDNDNFPKVLSKFKPYLRSEDNFEVIMAISVMRTSELLRLPISKDISTVTDPCRANSKTITEIINFIPTWVKRIPTLHLREMKYHMTVKNGPNGHALMESDSDISALMNTPELYEAIRTAEKCQADKDQMETEDLHSVDNPIHSKLTQFPEKAGKTRTIAVIDYYSQRCLHPLHKGLMTLLSNLVSDGTYSHLNVGKFAAQKTNDKSFVACADLTAATDRFPAVIQEALLHELLQNRDLSESLWTLLAKRTFTVAWSGEQVSYQCGQPMGAHASWPLFALAHHLIVEYAAYKCGIPNIKARYRLIGDDVIICDEAVWLSYRDLMLNLGLTINQGKTVISPKSSTNSSAEVAKQIYLNGRCLTPLTPGFVRDLGKPYMFNSCMRVLSERYGEWRPIPYSMIVESLFPKEKQRRLVGLLLTNPVTGILKPGEPGYEELSPWTVELSTKAVREYRKIFAQNFISKATDCTTKQMFHVFSGGSPWKDSTRPQPKCLRRVYKDTMFSLSEALNKVKVSFFDSDLDSLMDVASFVPNPDVPYMERKDLFQRRASSSIIELYDSITNKDEQTDCTETATPLPGLSGLSLVAMPIRPLS